MKQWTDYLFVAANLKKNDEIGKCEKKQISNQ